MCHLRELPARKMPNAYWRVRDDLESNNGEPREGPQPVDQELQNHDPLKGMERGMLDRLFAMNLELVWPQRQERLSEIEPRVGIPWVAVRLLSYFRETRARTHEVPYYSPVYDDHFLRKFCLCLPIKLDFDSWVSRELIEYVASVHDISPDTIRPSEDKRRLIYEPSPTSHPMWGVWYAGVVTDLDAIPQFLAMLAIQVAQWLPVEMQLIISEADDDSIEDYRRGQVSVDLRTTRPWEDCRGRFLHVCCMHAKLFLGYDWLELPFGYEVDHW